MGQGKSWSDPALECIYSGCVGEGGGGGGVGMGEITHVYEATCHATDSISCVLSGMTGFTLHVERKSDNEGSRNWRHTCTCTF